jgi:hypothetical protein
MTTMMTGYARCCTGAAVDRDTVNGTVGPAERRTAA